MPVIDKSLGSDAIAGGPGTSLCDKAPCLEVGSVRGSEASARNPPSHGGPGIERSSALVLGDASGTSGATDAGLPVTVGLTQGLGFAGVHTVARTAHALATKEMEPSAWTGSVCRIPSLSLLLAGSSKDIA